MEAVAVDRSGRPAASRVGAVVVLGLALALAALLHLLVCAHGPVAPGAARTDVLTAAATARGPAPRDLPAADRPHRPHTTPVGDGAAGCVDADEPTVPSPRAAGAPVPVTPALLATGQAAGSAYGRGRCGPPGTRGGVGHPAEGRAVLGVWRT
ncbi:hypothetical protein ACIBEA_23090 [Streptomyces sp. NPDC051555]|uniref:hypothetical protein n=1 Tax=Streptomyces sp. NPDC051555 TaxID=3365657 RepID=UPI0037931EA2